MEIVISSLRFLDDQKKNIISELNKFVENLSAELDLNHLEYFFIPEVLDSYLWTATITFAEDRRLARTQMPKNWDQADIKARYHAEGIELLTHDKSYLY